MSPGSRSKGRNARLFAALLSGRYFSYLPFCNAKFEHCRHGNQQESFGITVAFLDLVYNFLFLSLFIFGIKKKVCNITWQAGSDESIYIKCELCSVNFIIKQR